MQPSNLASNLDGRPRALLPTPSLVALIAAFVTVVVIGVLQLRSLDARADTSRAMDRAYRVELEIQALFATLADAETGQRGFVITNDEHYLAPYENARAVFQTQIDALNGDIDIAEQRHDVDAIASLAHLKLDELASTIEKVRTGAGAEALAMIKTDRGKQYMDAMRAIGDKLVAAAHQTLAERSAEWDATVRHSSYIEFGGLALLVVTLLALGLLASRDYRAVTSASWVRRIQALVATTLQGDLRIESLGDKALSVIAPSVAANVGALYTCEADGLLRIAGHALASSQPPEKIAFGEGVTGQAAAQKRLVRLRDVPEDYLRVGSALGRARPRDVVIAPALVDGQLQAIVELGFLHPPHAVDVEAIERAAEAVAGAVRIARDRARLENLLAETQRQAEELQAQQEELRVTNEELEQQSRVLQLSQARLENQQTELEQINAQLESQTTSLERQRDELARASSELQRTNEYKSQFLANMSHELRTPLNSSLILAKLLADNKEGNLSGEQVQFASTIYGAGNDLLTLINDILDLSKIEAGMLDVRFEPVVVRRFVDELRAGFQPIAHQRELALDVTIAADVPETLETDPTRLQQILKNLLSNAFKFTERGGVALEITAHGGELAIAVRDTGIGIPPDQQELIFEPFRQADSTSTRKFGGTGLGLSISRDLAALLGGALRLDSRPGQGSTFTLALPVHRPASTAGAVQRRMTVTPLPGPAVAAPAASKHAPSRISSAELGPAPFTDDRAKVQPSSRTLLVIEDDVEFARVLHGLAHELEFLGLVADTAERGLALARHYVPSAILLDIQLPDRSGLAVLDALKRDPATRHIPVHVMSVADYTRTALEMGAVGYALKPVAREQIVDAIKHLEAKFTQTVRRLLIVEDDQLLRESTARLLAGPDVETTTAGTIAEALKHLAATTFDCMVLDLSLPDRSGLELLEEMSRGDQYSFPPVIVYTGRLLSKDQVHELERFSRSIIIKGARSPERLLDEVTLFLHQVESDLPADRQRMLRDARDREAVFEGRKILIVEDDVRNVFALTSVLEPKGAAVAIARNGREALARLEQQPDTDLVLMDIMMPEMDGLEATRRLRADPRFARLPIIALTAKAMIDDRQKCLDAGANDYIAKPLDVDKLLSLARIWIRK